MILTLIGMGGAVIACNVLVRSEGSLGQNMIWTLTGWGGAVVARNVSDGKGPRGPWGSMVSTLACAAGVVQLLPAV